MGEEIDGGDLRLDVVADTRGLEGDLRRKVDAAAARVRAVIRATVDSSGLRREVTEAARTAQATIKATVEVSAPQLRRAVRDAAAGVTAPVSVRWKATAADLRREARAAAERVIPTLAAQVRFRAAQILAALRAALAGRALTVAVDVKFSAAQIRRALRETMADTRLQVRVDVDIRAAQLRRAVREAAATAGATVAVDLKVGAGQKAKVKAEIDRLGGTATVDLDTRSARGTLERFRGFMRGALQGALGWVISPSRWSALGAGLRSVASTATSLFALLAKGAGFAALAGGAVQALGAVKALIPALGALGVIPAVGFAGAAAMGVLKLALAGVGDLVKDVFSGKDIDPEAFERLGVAGQKLVLAFQAVKPAVDDFRKSVSDRVLAGLDGDVRSLAGVWLPVLKARLGEIGGSLNVLLRDALAFAGSTAFVGDISAALGNVAVATGRLQFLLPSVLSIFQDLVAVGSTFLPGLASGLNNAANAAQAFVHEARESGRLAEWIRTGLDTVRQLGALLVQVGGIIQAVFSAASASSSGFLGNLTTLLTGINAFLSAGEGKQALTSFFASLASVTQAVLPIVLALASAAGGFLVPALASLVQILAPSVLPVIAALRVGLEALLPGVQILASGLGAGLKALVDTGALQALGGALSTGLASLGSVLPLVGRALGELVVAAAPLLPIVGDLAGLILQLAAIGLSNLARILGPVIKALSEGLHPVLEAGMRALSAWAPLVAKIAGEIGGKLGDALQRVLPKLTEVAVKIIDSLVPHLPELAELVSKCADAFLEFLGPATDGLVDFIDQVTAQLLPHLPELVAIFVQLALAGARWLPIAFRILGWAVALITPVIQAGLAFKAFGKPLLEAAQAVGRFAGATIGALRDAWNWIVGLPDRIGTALASAWRSVKAWFSNAGQQAGEGAAGVGRWFQELPGKIGGWLSELPAKAGRWLADTASEMATKFLHGVGMLIGYAIALPQLIMIAIRELPAKASAFFSQLWTDVTTWTTTKLTELLAWLSGLPDRALAALSGLYEKARVWWNGLWRDTTTWATNGINDLILWVKGIPDRALAALASLGAVLSGAMSSAWAWAKQAAVDGINSLINYIYGIPGRVSALGGQLWDAGRSLINSLLNGLSSLGNGLQNVANSIVGAVKGGLNWVIRKINEGIASVDHIPGVSLPRIPLLARGALVTKATLAVIGEAGAELVLPLTNRRRLRELAQQTGLVDLLRQAGVFAQGPAIAVPGGGILSTRPGDGTRPAGTNQTRDESGRETQAAGSSTVINLYGNKLSTAEQLAAIGAELVWRMRGKG